jgi:phage nucleotide-binding protein
MGWGHHEYGEDLFDEIDDVPARAGVGGNVKTQMNQRQAAPPKPPAARRMTLEAVTTGAERPPERLLIYGSGGIGKTTFLAELGGSTIFIDTQDGSKRLKGVARFPQPKTWQDTLDALDVLANDQHPYKRVVIDLVDDIEQDIWRHICRRDGKDNIEGYGYGGGYKVALGEWRIMLAKLERLRHEKGMEVAFAAHVFIEKFNNPEGPDYDRYQLQLNKHAAGLLRGWCDNVLFAREQVRTETDRKTKRTRGVSNNIRVVHTVGTAAYYAKNRDNLPDTLPLDAGEYLAAVAASEPASADDVRAEIAQTLEGFTDAAYVAKAQKIVEDAGDDANKLLRILNKLRERLSTNEPQEQKIEETSNE